MRSVEVKKDELHELLVLHRGKHRHIFEEALKGFQKEARRLLDAEVSRAKKGLKRNLFIHLECPQDHTRDYDRAIEMLKMEVKDTVELSEQEFAEFVQDDWSWQRQWLASNSSYSPTAASYYATEYGSDED